MPPTCVEASARDLVVAVVRQHADSLLRVARRYTSCAADAEDAYQRALEIFVKNAHRLEAEGAHKWLHVVVRHEALAVRRARSALVGVEDEETLDALDDGRHVASVEERSERFDELARAAEALQRLKPQEVTALWLKAQGLSYEEIGRRQGWTYTKVNRCITEGRRAFLARYEGIETGEECSRWADVLSAFADGEATAEQLAAARPHLRNCPSCRSSLASMRSGGAAIAALLPPALPLADGSGMLSRLGEMAAALHDRAATTALKVQAAAEAATAGKLAAAAASAAALAGGGVAVERQLDGDPARAEPPAARVERSAAITPPTTTPDPSGSASGAATASAPASGEPASADSASADAASRERGEAGPEQPPAGAAFAPEADAPAERPAPASPSGTAEERPAPAWSSRTSEGRSDPPPSGPAGGEFGFVPASP